MPIQKLTRKWLQPLMTSCVKDYKGHSLVQTGFTEPPNNFQRESLDPVPMMGQLSIKQV